MRCSYAIVPPDDQLPEGWLVRYDSEPTILPDWPESSLMAIVCVAEQGDGTGTRAFVITDPAYLSVLADPTRDPHRHLFFRVPRSILLRDPEICPGLTPESWSDACE